MKVLITGITGFVGSHLAEYILEKKAVGVCGLLRWRAPLENIQHIVKDIHLRFGDLLDGPSLRKILKEELPDAIFHLAAQSYVPYSFDAPIATLHTNVIGTCNLLQAIKELKEEVSYNPFIHICSSSEVYGQVKEDEIPIKETNPFRPASPYAVSKVAEDMLGFQYFISWGLRTVRTRMFTHTGPRRGEVFATSSFARKVAAIEAGLQDPVIRVGNLQSVRTFLDVTDAVKAYWMLQQCPPGEVYNIGGKETMKVGEMLDILLNLSMISDIEVQVDPARLRPSDVTLQIPCIDKFTQATGWQPQVPFVRTMESLLNYWRNKLHVG